MDRVIVLDTTLRDGEQAPGYSMNIEEKVKLACQLEALGVDVIEAGFAISSQLDADSIKAIAASVKNVTVSSLARCVKKDIDVAYDSVKDAVKPRLHVFLATSDLHLEYKLKIDRETAIQRVIENVKYAASLCSDIEFSCEDATRSDLEYMAKVVEAAIDAGATTINLPDTVGFSTPEDIITMVNYMKEHVSNLDKAVISMHNHNDLGLALANTMAGLSCGARQVECTLCGIGERAGNAALEEFAMLLYTRGDKYPYKTNIVTQEITKSAKLLTNITGVKCNPSKAIVGANAFAHESGIHQHGIMAHKETYEIMTPESIGLITSNMVLGKHSGQHAFSKKLVDLGYVLSEAEVTKYFKEFKDLCNKKKTILEKDIVALIEAKEDVNSTWTLDSFVVNSGNKMVATASITLIKDNKKYHEVASASGPVYAAVRCVEKIVRHQFSLDDYQLEAVTEDRDALGEATILASDANGSYRGRGISTDVIEASILACLSAVNKMFDSDMYSIHETATITNIDLLNNN